MYTEAFLKAEEEDFPGGPLFVHLPSKAGGAGLISAWGSKIPHAMEQLSLHTAATEARMLWSTCATTKTDPMQFKKRKTVKKHTYHAVQQMNGIIFF